MKKFVSLLAAGTLALTLSACGGEPEAPVTNVETNLTEIETGNDMANMAMPEPTPEASPTAVPAPAGKDFDETVTEDDAAATGMTSRVDRGNETQPAQ